MADGTLVPQGAAFPDGTLVPQGAAFPDGTLIAGLPAQAVRALTSTEIASLDKDAHDQRDEAGVQRRQLAGSMIQQAFRQLG